jgi:hypothetical protein
MQVAAAARVGAPPESPGASDTSGGSENESKEEG